MNSNKRAVRLKLNIASSLIFQITTLICGFILPRLILQSFGSSANGLVQSISQFLQIIAFLELGVGAVVQSSLYKPLANNDVNSVSKIVVSAGKFFKRIAYILSGYIMILIVVYPISVSSEFDWIYTVLMILALSISSFSQYYFGIVDRLLLTAAQQGYVQYIAQTVTLLLNTVACWLLIKLGAGLHTVKLTTSLIYLLRPIFLRWYVNHHYQIDRHIRYRAEPIKQKWNGVAQHVAAVVLDGTDNIVLTLFSTLGNVSIYSVYNLVVYGVKNLLFSLTSGVQSLMGELLAKQEFDELKRIFGRFEWIMHTGTVFVFGCTATLIMPFVSVYTAGVNDVNYIQPLFAILISMANAGHCLRLPYNIMILAGGHFKQTQRCYVVAVILNIIFSVILVIRLGLVGVAIGTLVAMIYQTVWMVYYVSKNLIKWPLQNFIKQIMVDILSILISVTATSWVPMITSSYVSWLIIAIETAAIWGAVMFIINIIFYKEYTIKPIITIKNKFSNTAKTRV